MTAQLPAGTRTLSGELRSHPEPTQPSPLVALTRAGFNRIEPSHVGDMTDTDRSLVSPQVPLFSSVQVSHILVRSELTEQSPVGAMTRSKPFLACQVVPSSQLRRATTERVESEVTARLNAGALEVQVVISESRQVFSHQYPLEMVTCVA